MSFLSRPALLPLLLFLSAQPALSHFLFARLDEDETQVRVMFSEPPPQEGEGVTYLGGRVTNLAMIGPTSPDTPHTFQNIDLEELDEDGYLLGTLPEKVDNTPYFITGFLDYGDFGEGDGPKSDLQYTFSTQISSTNPSDDFSHFVHYVAGTDAASPYGEDIDPFAIALNNYGPPYRVVMRGVGASTPVRVCMYEGDGSNAEVGCVTGTHNRTHHLTFDAEAFGVLRPCETYFALANTTSTDEVTGKAKSQWSSTSITWNGPCTATPARNSVPQWYKQSTFRGGGCPKTTTTKDATMTTTMKDATMTTTAKAATVMTASAAESAAPTSSNSADSQFSMATPVVFIVGLLTGMFGYHITMKQKLRGTVAHSQIDSVDTTGYSDDKASAENEII